MTSHTNLKTSIEILKNTLINKIINSGSYPTEIEGLSISLRHSPTPVDKCFYKPVIVMFLQGNKKIIFGDYEHNLKENDVLISGIDIPVSSFVSKASTDEPYMAIVLELDITIILQLLAEIPHEQLNENKAGGLLIQSADAEITHAFLRLIELLDKPQQIPIFSEQIKREIYYYLLTGINGPYLCSLYALGSQNNQVARAVTWLKQNIAQSIKIEDLAKKANMSASTFYRYFKEMTSLSPIQYQKRLRLHEAQRLMLVKNIDATSSAFSVGYENFGQFSREYKRLFGEPPRKNIISIKGKK